MRPPAPERDGRGRSSAPTGSARSTGPTRGRPTTGCGPRRPYWQNPEGVTILTRYADCEAVLRDARFSSSNDHADPPMILAEGDPRGVHGRRRRAPLIFLDPPDHTRLRKLVSKAFTPRSVERLRPRVQEVVDGILDRAADEGGLDVVADLGYELPVIVICELLGVPLERSAAVRRLVVGRLPAARRRPRRRTRSTPGSMAAISFAQYFAELFEERRHRPARRPGERAARGRGGGRPAEHRGAAQHRDPAVHRRPRDHDEPDRQRHLRAARASATSSCGGVTTRRSTRRRSRSCCASTVPCTSPAASRSRTSRSTATSSPGASRRSRCCRPANRDPARFDHPDRLDLGRPDNHQLTFSQGIHYCLGAALARLEGQVAIGSLIRRFPDLELAAQPVYRDHFVLRGLTELRVSV